MNNILGKLQAGFRHWTAAVTGFAVWQSCSLQQTLTSHNSSSLAAVTLPWEGVIAPKLSFCSLLHRFIGFLRRIISSLICNSFPIRKWLIKQAWDVLGSWRRLARRWKLLMAPSTWCVFHWLCCGALLEYSCLWRILIAEHQPRNMCVPHACRFSYWVEEFSPLVCLPISSCARVESQMRTHSVFVLDRDHQGWRSH